MCNDKDNKIFNGRDEKGRFVKGNIPLNTVYSDDIPDKLIEYLNKHIHDIKLCSIAGFCHENGIHIPTYSQWLINEDEKYDRLKRIHAHFKEMQCQQIIDGAINRTFDPSFAQFLLKAQHGLRDKQEISLDSKTDGTLDININVVK